MSGIELVRRLHQHQRWVAQQLLQASRGLTPEQLNRPFEIGPGSLLATLNHMYSAEFVWLEAIEGNARAAFPAKQADVESLGRVWDALETRWQVLLGKLTDEDLDRPVVRIRPSAPDKPLTSRLSDVLLHGGTHAYYHTAQAINMMRHLGVQPLPDTMLIVMSRMGL